MMQNLMYKPAFLWRQQSKAPHWDHFICPLSFSLSVMLWFCWHFVGLTNFLCNFICNTVRLYQVLNSLFVKNVPIMACIDYFNFLFHSRCQAWIDCLVLEQLHHPYHGLRRSFINNAVQWQEYFQVRVDNSYYTPSISLEVFMAG